jgi:hypothetical protein
MSTLKVNSIEPANAGSEDYFLARAWVNFNGTGTVAIRESGNVSSITDTGTGRTQITFSAAMPSASYATSGAASKNDTTNDGNMHCQCNGYNNGSSNPNTTVSSHVVTAYVSNTSQQDCGVVTHTTTH